MANDRRLVNERKPDQSLVVEASFDELLQHTFLVEGAREVCRALAAAIAYTLIES